MWNITANAKNRYNFQLSVFLFLNLLYLPLTLLGVVGLSSLINLILVSLIYIFLCKNVVLQLKLLVFLRKSKIQFYFKILKKIYPFTNPSLHFCIFLFGFCFSLVHSLSPHLCLIYYFFRILLNGIIIPLLSYQSLFYSKNFYDYISERETDLKNFPDYLKVISLINQLKKTF